MPGPTVVRLDYQPLYELGRVAPINVPVRVDPVPTAQDILALMEAEVNSPDVAGAVAVSINDYTRIRMREDGFYRRLMPPVPISDEALPVQDLRPVRERAAEIESKRRVEERMKQLVLQQEVAEVTTIKPNDKKRKLIRE